MRGLFFKIVINTLKLALLKGKIRATDLVYGRICANAESVKVIHRLKAMNLIQPTTTPKGKDKRSKYYEINPAIKRSVEILISELNEDELGIKVTNV